MGLELLTVPNNDLKAFKNDAQEAFQKGYEKKYGKTQKTVLPAKDIDQSLNAKDSIAYKAVLDGVMVGGVIITIDKQSQNNHLDILYVKHGIQSKGIGKAIWFEIEKLYPETKTWETFTPYFESRNLHFYINVCGFHVVEFFNEKNPMPDTPEDFIGDGGEGMLKFLKQMNPIT